MKRSRSAAASAERHTASDHSRQRSATRLVEDLAQPGLGQSLGVVAGGRSSALAPCRSDLLLDLAPVRQPVLGVPDRASRSVDAEDMPARWPDEGHNKKRTASSGHIRDIFRDRAKSHESEYICLQRHPDAAGGDRTHDLRIKSPLLCQLSYGGLDSMIAYRPLVDSDSYDRDTSATSATASISTSIRGSIRALTSTIVISGRMSPNTSPWARPTSAPREMSVT